MLIRTSCYILLHLSEDPSVEDKMRKKGIVRLLVKTLQRKHEHSSVNGILFINLYEIIVSYLSFDWCRAQLFGANFPSEVINICREQR